MAARHARRRPAPRRLPPMPRRVQVEPSRADAPRSTPSRHKPDAATAGASSGQRDRRRRLQLAARRRRRPPHRRVRRRARHGYRAGPRSSSPARWPRMRRVVLVGLGSADSRDPSHFERAVRQRACRTRRRHGVVRRHHHQGPAVGLHLISSGQTPADRGEILVLARAWRRASTRWRAATTMSSSTPARRRADLEAIGEIAPHAVLVAETPLTNRRDCRGARAPAVDMRASEPTSPCSAARWRRTRCSSGAPRPTIQRGICVIPTRRGSTGLDSWQRIINEGLE